MLATHVYSHPHPARKLDSWMKTYKWQLSAGKREDWTLKLFAGKINRIKTNISLQYSLDLRCGAYMYMYVLMKAVTLLLSNWFQRMAKIKQYQYIDKCHFDNIIIKQMRIKEWIIMIYYHDDHYHLNPGYYRICTCTSHECSLPWTNRCW